MVNGGRLGLKEPLLGAKVNMYTRKIVGAFSHQVCQVHATNTGAIIHEQRSTISRARLLRGAEYET